MSLYSSSYYYKKKEYQNHTSFLALLLIQISIIINPKFQWCIDTINIHTYIKIKRCINWFKVNAANLEAWQPKNCQTRMCWKHSIGIKSSAFFKTHVIPNFWIYVGPNLLSLNSKKPYLWPLVIIPLRSPQK